MPLVTQRAVLLVLGVWLIGCSSNATNTGSPVCSAGEAESCNHVSGCNARKVCGTDGQFGSCECIDAGSAGASSGGAGGSAGSSGGGGAGGSSGSAATGGSSGSGTGGDAGCDAPSTSCSGKCGSVPDPCGTVECGACPDPLTHACITNACVCDCASKVSGAPNCEGKGCSCSGHNNNTDESNCGCSGVACPTNWSCDEGVCNPP